MSVEPALAGLFGAFGSDAYGTSGAEGEYSPATAPIATPMVQYRLALYDTNDQPLPIDASGNATIPVGEDFRLVGYHRDITYDASDFVGEGVYAAYVDIFHTNAHHLMVRHGETQQLEFYPQVENGDIEGTFTLTFEDLPTVDIEYTKMPDTLAFRIQNALAALPNIGLGNVRVTPVPKPDDPPPGIQPNAFRIDFLNDLGERDVPTLGIDSHELSGLRDVEGVIIDELFPAELDNPGTFRNSFRVVEDAVINGMIVDNPFIHGLNASLKEQLAPGQPAGGSAWGNVGSFLEGFYSPDASAEFAFFSVDIRAIAPGRVEFSASAPDIEQEVNHGFETLVFPTIKETPKFVVDPADIDFLETLDNPLVLEITPPPMADVAGRSAEDGTWWVGESTGNQFVSSPWGGWPAIVDWQDVVVGDFTGDGRDEIVGRKDGVWWVARSTESGLVNEEWGRWSTNVTWVDVMVADVNGDGKADIVGRVEASGYWWVAVNNGDGTFTNQRWTRWNASVMWVDVVVGDFTGNGFDDIAGRNAANGDWWVAVNNGDGTFTNQRWTWWNPDVTWVDVMVGDFTGNRKADLIGRNAANGDWWVARSTGEEFITERWGRWNASVPWLNVMAADVTGDGKDDVVGRVGGDWWVAKSTASSFVNERWLRLPAPTEWTNVSIANLNGNPFEDIVWRDGNGDWTVARSTGTSFINEIWGNWSTSIPWTDVLVADLDGDGKDDIIGRGEGVWQAAKSDGVTFENEVWGEWQHYVVWQDVLVGDFTGNGLDDIAGRKDGVWWVARSTESGFVNEEWGRWSTNVTWVDVMVADVNGDGKADIVGRVEASGYWWVAVNNGDGTFTNQRFTRWNANATWVDVMVGDFTGNGFDDIAGRNAANGDWWVAVNNGDGTFTNQRWTWWNSDVTWVDVMVGDFTGNRKADLIGRNASNGDWWVARSTGEEFITERWGRWNASVQWLNVMAADVTGDGKDDIVGRAGGDWWVAKSMASSFVNERWLRLPAATDWADVSIANVNGNQFEDIVWRDGNGNWTVARSTGTAFVKEIWGSWPTDVVWQDVLIGNFSNRIPDAMHASGLPPADHGAVAELTEADLQWIVDAAIPQLAEAAGWDAGAHPLDSVTFQIADLPGTLLGQTLGTTVLIDRNAAGFGWFVDRTPWDNEEFWQTTAGDLLALPGGPADGRMDLLTVVMHELGHVLGYDHSDSGLMQPTLAPGVRYLWEDLLGDHLMDDSEGESAVDDFFAAI